jgi:hypothetical protein
MNTPRTHPTTGAYQVPPLGGEIKRHVANFCATGIALQCRSGTFFNPGKIVNKTGSNPAKWDLPDQKYV